jgi:hypothetical protein
MAGAPASIQSSNCGAIRAALDESLMYIQQVLPPCMNICPPAAALPHPVQRRAVFAQAMQHHGARRRGIGAPAIEAGHAAPEAQIVAGNTVEHRMRMHALDDQMLDAAARRHAIRLQIVEDRIDQMAVEYQRAAGIEMRAQRGAMGQHRALVDMRLDQDGAPVEKIGIAQVA